MPADTLAPSLPIEAPFSAHTRERAIRMVRAGWLSRVRWGEMPPGTAAVTVAVPSFEPETHPDEEAVHTVRYARIDDTTSCTCIAGRNGRHCSHVLVALLWLGVLPSLQEARPDPEPAPWEPAAGFRAAWETWGGGAPWA